MAFSFLNRTPTLAEIIQQAIEKNAADTRVALPGKIEKYDPITQKADIKPLIQRLTQAEDYTEFAEALPVITDVPVIFPRSGSFFVSFPLAKGDCVLILFNDFAIDNYLISKRQGDDMNPDDFRTHALRDAICLPGFYPFVSSLKQADATNMALGKDNGGIQIHLTPGGVAEVKFGGGNAMLSAAIAEHLQSLYAQIVTAFMTHMHPTGVGPSGTPTTTFPPWDSTGTIASDKLKLES